MAAGTSLVQFCLGLTIFCVTLLGITGLSDLEPKYSVLSNYETDVHFSNVQFRSHDAHASSAALHYRRFRRDAEAETTNVNSSISNQGDNATAAPASSTAGGPGAATASSSQAAGGSSTQTASTSTTPPPSTTDPYTHVEVNHTYYKTVVINGKEAENIWIDLDAMAAAKQASKKTPDALSDSHRTASSVTMNFKFIFYGHELDRVTVATGGFLYMSNFLHQWLTATQYVAPLMANFDTQVGNNSRIHYFDNGTTFVVHWEDVHLQDQPTAGKFNFQAQLWEDGRVFLVYKEVPVAVNKINNTRHPVKIGLSDAYYMDKTVSSDVRRRTIYEYHRVNVNLSSISSHTAVLIQPLQTCIQQKSCNSCLTHVQNFKCEWCPKIARCSDGLDRHRQDWLLNNCDHDAQQAEQDQCNYYDTNQHLKDKNKDDVKVGAVIAIVVILVIVIVMALWVTYAYTHPNSSSGMWLIDHRPSALKDKLNKVKFWKRADGGEKYEVSMHPDGESVA